MAQAGKAPGGLPSRTPWFVICHLGHILKLTRALTAHPVLILSLLIWVAWKSSWESFGRNSFLLQSFLSFGNGTLPITKHQIWPLNIFCSKICFKKILISLKQIYQINATSSQKNIHTFLCTSCWPFPQGHRPSYLRHGTHKMFALTLPESHDQFSWAYCTNGDGSRILKLWYNFCTCLIFTLVSQAYHLANMSC